MSDMSDYGTWKASARKSAAAAIDIYADREADVERELALHLARAIRELDKRDERFQQIMSELGVPQPDYPQPVANAYEVAEASLA